jgi:hypothetical protein
MGVQREVWKWGHETNQFMSNLWQPMGKFSAIEEVDSGSHHFQSRWKSTGETIYPRSSHLDTKTTPHDG